MRLVVLLSGRGLAWHEDAVCLLIGIAKKTKEMKGERGQSCWHFTQCTEVVLLAHAEQQGLDQQPSSLCPPPAFSFLRIHFLQWLALHLQELDLQVVMSCQMWALGTQFRLSTRAACALKGWDVCLAPGSSPLRGPSGQQSLCYPTEGHLTHSSHALETFRLCFVSIKWWWDETQEGGLGKHQSCLISILKIKQEPIMS